LKDDFHISAFEELEQLDDFLNAQTLLTIPEILIMEVDNDNSDRVFDLVKKIKETPLTCGLIIVIIALHVNEGDKAKAIELKVNDYYEYPFDVEELDERLKFLIKFKLIKPEIKNLSINVKEKYKMPLSKRLFDIAVSSVTILLLSPVFILLALIIRLESKGPVIYRSKRAGTGYKIFDFYKFRSMNSNADQQLKELSHSNQYANECDVAFVKIKNDPRVTKIGRFIRKTSMDELPQLFNVLKGDMSIVGNRPLPLYEAELLTSNEWCIRFLGPAGITGLWQISKRGKSEMSDKERRQLDNYYVNHSSILFDLKIIALTVPAIFQKENV
jgi:lipopolysaccharide/colanic/teichoic acid biosynthesis glycosyltransferase/CheY-like chemotaxis protein